MTDNKKLLNDLIVEATALILEIDKNPEYKDLIAEKDESFAPAADAHGAMAEICGALDKKEKQG